MLSAVPNSSRHDFEDRCLDDVFDNTSCRAPNRENREARRSRERGVENRLHVHTQILFDRTLRSQERAALMRGLTAAHPTENNDAREYTTTTRLIFALSLLAIIAGLVLGVKFLIGDQFTYFVACSGILSVGFGLLSIAARRGSTEVRT
ncbi:hypothetical protein [Methylobacterium sp. 22177]|uniref:hypothetical protein n=1 Tax=Methylobacterium sp. 22177 TaxID=3453885 RepID=UPI003F82C323